MTDAVAGAEDQVEDAAEAPLPLAVAVGPLDVVADDDAFGEAIARLAAGTGPVAVDAERANGFRYSGRAYLVQLFRRGSGTVLLDPPALTRFAELQAAIGDEEWIIHAASQDLPCLRELGLEPARLFDTEQGARIAGFDRVGLAAVTDRLLGVHLKKEHAASDWSTRPIPDSWLEYAALDVELLVDLRDALAAELDAQGKHDIAAQEFEATLHRQPKPAPAEPWRRLSGIHSIRDRRVLAVARELWLARDAYAREIDRAPGRLVPDAALMAAATGDPQSKGQLSSIRAFTGRASRSEIDRWWDAVERGRGTSELPTLRVALDGPPPPRFWKQKRPQADARLTLARAAVAEQAESLRMPSENLLTPDTLRRVVWDSADGASADDVAESLARLGARPWQIDATAQIIASSFVEADQRPVEPVDDGS